VKNKLLILLAILILDAASGLGVVYTRQENRQLSAQLGALESWHDDAMAEWSRLQIEQALLADAGQIESKAVKQLNMKQPDRTRILVVRP